MKLSLVFPVLNENLQNSLAMRLQDIDSFFSKTPFQIECLFVADPCRDNSLQVLNDFKPQSTNLEFKFITNAKKLGRAGSVLLGLNRAQHDLVITCSLDLSAPLSEVYSLIQELLSDEQLDLVTGNRMTSRKKRSVKRSKWHLTLEDIICEKNRARGFLLQDPLTSMMGFRKTRLQDWQNQVKKSQSNWYFCGPWIAAATGLSLKHREVPILYADQLPSRIPLIKEYWHNLF